MINRRMPRASFTQVWIGVFGLLFVACLYLDQRSHHTEDALAASFGRIRFDLVSENRHFCAGFARQRWETGFDWYSHTIELSDQAGKLLPHVEVFETLSGDSYVFAIPYRLISILLLSTAVILLARKSRVSQVGSPTHSDHHSP